VSSRVAAAAINRHTSRRLPELLLGLVIDDLIDRPEKTD